MNLKRLMLASAMALAGAAGAAQAADTMGKPAVQDGWYINLGGAFNWAEGSSFRPLVAGVTGHSVSFDDGYGVAGALGYKFTNNWRAELELAYRENDVKGLSPFATAGGSSKTFSQMLNVIYDVPLSPGWVLSLGGGLGGANRDLGVSTGALSVLSGDDYKFAYQGIAGVAYQVSDQVSLFGEYRHMRQDSTSVAVALPARGSVSVDNVNNSALLGVRIFLNPPPAPAPAPKPAPVAAPAPAPVPMNYIVFFDFNKSTITPEAKAIITQAVAAAKAKQKVTVQITGHTDTVGSAKYNDALSMKRAEAVKAEMIAGGLPGDEIGVSGAGFSKPLVPTGPGVREPQNRRAEIVLN